MQGVRLAVVGNVALAGSSPRLADLAHTLGLVQQEELQGGASHISCKHSHHLSCSCLGCHLCALRRFTFPPTGALYFTMPHYKSRAVAPTLTSCWHTQSYQWINAAETKQFTQLVTIQCSSHNADRQLNTTQKSMQLTHLLEHTHIL